MTAITIKRQKGKFLNKAKKRKELKLTVAYLSLSF
jgi:hypothetical protein